jgi:membrane fusion protein (multidrug efflux system)
MAAAAVQDQEDTPESAVLPSKRLQRRDEAHHLDPPLGQPPGVGVAPQDLPGPVLEAFIQPGDPPGAGPMRLEIDPAEQPPDGAGRDARDRRGGRPAANQPGPVRAMNPIAFARRRPVTTLMLVVALVSGGVLGLSKLRADAFPPLNTPKIHGYLDYIEKRAKQVKGYIGGQLESYFKKHEEQPHQEHQTIVVTSPKAMDVVITQPYVCQIHSQRHIDVCALENGYLQGISVREGQAVKKGDVMFKIVPILYQAKYEAEKAEARLAELEFNNTRKLFENKGQAIVSENEVLLFQAKLAKAQAKVKQAEAELNFTEVRAPFDGIVDRQHEQLGSLIKEGEFLTTLSDNSVMWVYFNVPEADYLEYMAASDRDKQDQKIELVLANGNKFPHTGKIGAIEAQFNNETGNIAFRADFPNPEGLLRHGQTGTVLIHRTLHNALVIPQRATFEILANLYVWVVGEDHVAHQREIVIQNEMEDIYVIKSGLDVKDKIVLEGGRQVRDGEKVEYEFRSPEEVMANQKNHAE